MTQPNTSSTINSDNFCAIGIDIGGTKIAAGVVTFPEGEVRARRRIPTAPKSGEPLLAEILSLANELLIEARTLHLEPAAIGLGICELVSPAGEILSANCIDWKGMPIGDRLAVQKPVVIEADVRAAALAEALFGAGRGTGCFLYLTVGTGISSCLVLEGKPFTGARGATGTMASAAWNFACDRCGHAAHQSLEEIASGPALVTRYRARGGAAEDAKAVLAAAVAGDKVAREVVTSATAALGQAVAWLINTLDPEVVIIGGGLGLAGGLYWERLLSASRQHIWSPVHRQLPIVQAKTGSDAGVIGAAASAWAKMPHSLRSG